jgi:hypothetical protein
MLSKETVCVKSAGAVIVRQKSSNTSCPDGPAFEAQMPILTAFAGTVRVPVYLEYTVAFAAGEEE